MNWTIRRYFGCPIPLQSLEEVLLALVDGRVDGSLPAQFFVVGPRGGVPEAHQPQDEEHGEDVAHRRVQVQRLSVLQLQVLDRAGQPVGVFLRIPR